MRVRLLPLLFAGLLLGSIAQASPVAPRMPQHLDEDERAIEGRAARVGHVRPPFHTHQTLTNKSPSGWTPAAIRHAYGLDQIPNAGAGQTIAIIEAYDSTSVEADLAAFVKAFNLPPCTTANRCFTKVYASGSKPQSDPGWALEAALDVEWAHAIAPEAKIMLVEAASSNLDAMMQAVDVAVRAGASVVSMSFGGPEWKDVAKADAHFKVARVSFVASSGDNGNGAEYPASSPYVLSVGGTRLSADIWGNYVAEAAWSGSGGGLSAYEPQTAAQATWPLPVAGKRGAPDVAYHADAALGFPVYSSVVMNSTTGWFRVGGTSAGAPQWAAMLAIVNSLRAAARRAPLSAVYNQVYAVARNVDAFNDVTIGSNGSCGSVCKAAGGYDYVTGLGSPKAQRLVPALVALP